MTDRTTDAGHLLAGRYRLVRRIGAGAMGVVWQGHDERLDRLVAVKKLRLRPGLPQAKAAEAVARCLREGRIAARLHHPNAITVFDVVDEDDVPNLVMEFMPSRSMAAAIAEEGPLAPVDAAAVGAHVATALAAAHDAGIVHRDVSPGNVLLGEDGAVKLTDFGISRAVDDGAVTRTGPFAGTPAYLAPEVAHGTAPTAASDVFSLGATLYAAVEGESPFGPAPNVLALLHAVAGGEINPPQRSGPLTDVLLTLLTPDPHARPTAAQAQELLAAAGRGAPPAAVPARDTVRTAGHRTPVAADAAGDAAVGRKPAQPPSGRSRKPLAAAGLLVVATAAAGFWLLGGHHDAPPGQQQTPADGTATHRQPARPSAGAPVAPVGAPVDVGETRSTRKPASRAVPTTAPAEAAGPTNDDRATPPPPETTTGQVEEPTTSAETTAPSTSDEVPTTEPS